MPSGACSSIEIQAHGLSPKKPPDHFPFHHMLQMPIFSGTNTFQYEPPNSQLLTLFFILFSFSSLNAQVYKSNDEMGFEAQYELFLESVTCTAPERVLDHHVISGAAIPLPGFGMNGKIAYPADEPSWVDDMHFGIPLFRNAISYMGLDNLRFPGGTIANSLALYPRRLTFDTNTLQQDYYFINQERSDAELIPPTQQASFFFEGSSMRKDPYMEVDVDAGVNFNQFNAQIDLLLGMTEHSADANYGNGTLITPAPPDFSFVLWMVI